jgi:hypothetical protein
MGRVRVRVHRVRVPDPPPKVFASCASESFVWDASDSSVSSVSVAYTIDSNKNSAFWFDEVEGGFDFAIVQDQSHRLIDLGFVGHYLEEVFADILFIESLFRMAFVTADLSIVGIQVGDIVLSHEGGDLGFQLFVFGPAKLSDACLELRDFFIDRQPLLDLDFERLELIVGWERGRGNIANL